MNLSDIITDNYSYFLKNVGEGVYMDGKTGLSKAALMTLVGMTDKVKSEIVNKGGLDKYDALKYLLSNMDYIANRIQG